jgi:predicted neuraminidase
MLHWYSLIQRWFAPRKHLTLSPPFVTSPFISKISRALLLWFTLVSHRLPAQLAGGFEPASPSGERTLAAAKAAAAAAEGGARLFRVEEAEMQIVAGAVYRLKLQVDQDGTRRRAEAVVWQKPDMEFVLQSWRWLEATLSAQGVVKAEFIYENGPYPQVHASTIAETAGGLVAAWFGGTSEGNRDVCIWMARVEGDVWTPSVEVANGVQSDGMRYPTWNPVLFQPRDGPLMLFYKVGPSPERWWGELRTSPDGGRTWTAAARLPEGFLGPIKNKPVQLQNGDILCPTSNETHEKPSKWSVHFESSGDLGATWRKVGPVNDGVAIQAIQPSILLLGGEKLLALGRSRQDRVFEVRSEDGGRSWGELSLGTLPNNNSGTDAVTLHDGRHLIVYNHVAGTPGKWGGKRTPLNVAVSADARDWKAALVLESDPGEFSYPAVIQSGDGLVHITYTWKRQKVKHVVIDPLKLAAKSFVDGRWPE